MEVHLLIIILQGNGSAFMRKVGLLYVSKNNEGLQGKLSDAGSLWVDMLTGVFVPKSEGQKLRSMRVILQMSFKNCSSKTKPKVNHGGHSHNTVFSQQFEPVRNGNVQDGVTHKGELVFVRCKRKP